MRPEPNRDRDLNLVPPRRTAEDDSGVIRHRLTELERRTGKMEDRLDVVGAVLTEVRVRLEETPSKSWILYWFAGTFGVALVSLAGHIAIRALW